MPMPMAMPRQPGPYNMPRERPVERTPDRSARNPTGILKMRGLPF